MVYFKQINILVEGGNDIPLHLRHASALACNCIVRDGFQHMGNTRVIRRL